MIRDRLHDRRTPTGIGLGLRAEFLSAAHAGKADGRVAFFEVSPENYMHRGGPIVRKFEEIAARVPIITHGLMMSLGALDPFDDDYFSQLREFLDGHPTIASKWHSDHLCFSTQQGAVLHDLLPLPFDEGTALRVAKRIREAQDRLERPLAIENISYYLPVGEPRMREAEFVRIVCDEADCGLLLDVNNIYVNSKNFGFDVREMIASYPLERVVQAARGRPHSLVPLRDVPRRPRRDRGADRAPAHAVGGRAHRSGARAARARHGHPTAARAAR